MEANINHNQTQQVNQGKGKGKGSFFLQHLELFAALLSGVFIICGYMTAADENYISVICYLIAFVIGGFAKAKEGIIESIKSRDLNVELLMIFAAIGSAFIGYWMEGALLIFIFSLSGALETYTMNKSNRELSLLMKMQPEEAKVVKNGYEQKVSVSSLRIGDQIVVKAGERIPADGIIMKGQTTVDQSPITGESLPVVKAELDEVFSGTVNHTGVIYINVSKLASESLFSKIIQLVQQAESEKTPSQLFIERFEGLYVKLVLVAVLLTMVLPALFFEWSWSESFYRAMVLMVVASPCALVASIMPATLSAISYSARKGVLVKGGVHLERLAHTKIIALDKTGTLTKGQPVVTDFIIKDQANDREIKSAILSIEEQSTHPIAKSIVGYLLENKTERVNVTSIQETAGLGMKAYIAGSLWKIGKSEYVGGRKVEDFLRDKEKTLIGDGKTVVYIKRDEEILGYLALIDSVRESTKKAIKELQQEGIRTIMITGDNEQTASTIAELAEVDEYIANCLPEDKVNKVKMLQKKYGMVTMTGDGINDAPALATANVGISMGEGTDVALETADIILIKNDLSKIRETILLSKKMNRIIKQNVFFSITVIALLIISNFFQLIDLPFGVIGHEGSTILVILNGLRLLKL
ncbi:Cd2+/Zn2+-exporting ATPase [Bacillus mesophilus]|uniref:heavy metal translocating P-type ATPase n=1 Tax=Bacillus mesophilus TaxID=1808955 RepID=UPI0030846160|nr:Cd2+/Zn2+-exporting ATPase [Bacillus mesophilus]